MSIAPPTDIILDVAQAADPAKRQIAVDKLARMAAQGGTPPVDFQTALNSATPAAAATGAGTDRSLRLNPLTGAGGSQITAGHGSTYQRFEAMVLQNFVENILPKDNDLYGDQASGDMYRSMLADKLSDQLARAGGIGIAKTLEHHAALAAAAAADQAGATPTPHPVPGRTAGTGTATPAATPAAAPPAAPAAATALPLNLSRG